jgi:hypothetical protein
MPAMTLRKTVNTLVCVSALALTACGNGDADVKEKLGLKAAPPDEFSVVTRAPLSVPPDYTLRPPRPGEDRPMELSVREQTKQTVFGVSDVQNRQGESAGSSSSFLNKLGANQADPNIRQSINTEVREMDKKEQPVAERLLFWKEKEPPGKTIDPVEEKKRLEAQGVTESTTTTTTTGTSSDSDVQVEKRNEDILQTP